MTTWYVHRRADGSVASAHQEARPGYAEEALDQSSADLAPLLRPVTTYRDKRKTAYIAELGAKPDFVETVGDVLDDLIREMAARGTPVTPEFKALVDKIADIKLRFPKP